MHRSTAIAARIGPEAMRELMLEVYEVCVDAVARYEGRVTKYLGDGILALFGYPVAHEDDARRAVLGVARGARRGRAQRSRVGGALRRAGDGQDRGGQRRRRGRAGRRQPVVDRGDRRRPTQRRHPRAGHRGADDGTGDRRDKRS